MNVIIKKRDHSIEIFYRMFMILKKFLFPLAVGIVSYIKDPSKDWLLGLLTFLIIIAVITISILIWKSKTFEITTQSIRMSEGVFAKKVNEIPLTNVQSINTSHSFLKKMCNVSNLKVEVIGGGSIYFVLDNQDIAILKDQLFHDLMVETTDVSFRLTKKDIFVISCNPIHFFKGFSIIFGWATFILYQLRDYLHINETVENQSFKVTSMRDLIKELKGSKDDYMGPLEPLIRFWLHNNIFENIAYLLLGSFISYFIGVLLVFFKYRSFYVDTSEREITIQYGVFNQKLYHIPKHKIRSIQIVQPYFYKWFGYVKIKIENIGLGKRNTALEMIPILKETDLETFLHRHLPDFKQQDIQCKPRLRTLPFYLSRAIWIPIVVSTFLGFIWQPLFYLYGVIPLFIANAYLTWKHAGLTYNEQFFTLSKGNIFHTKKVIFLKKYVEVLETKESLIQKTMKTLTYSFSVYSEHKVDTHTCKDLHQKEKRSYLLMRKEKTHA